MSKVKIILLILGLGFAYAVYASTFSPHDQSTMSHIRTYINPESFNIIGSILSTLREATQFLMNILFYKIFGVPFMVIWIVTGGIFFTFALRFVNLRLFSHAIKVIAGKFDEEGATGEVSHFKALTAAISSTVGLGNIAGVALAVSMGGPGAIFWMWITGFFSMSLKFSEVFLGQYFRKVNENGIVSGGPHIYLKEGFKMLGKARTGKTLSRIYIILGLVGYMGAGGIFQINQAVDILSSSSPIFEKFDWAISAMVAFGIAFTLIGGVKRLTRITEILVPLMAITYVVLCLIIIAFHIENLPSSFSLIFKEAFNFSAIGGGFLGALIAGVRRGAFSNEGGMGTASIIHATAKTNEPCSEASVSLLEPFIDTIIICTLSGLVIIITGAFKIPHEGIEGITLMAKAFSSVTPWFTHFLTFSACLFATSTILTYSYYMEQLWKSLFTSKNLPAYYMVFCFMIFIGGIMDDLTFVVNLTDVFYLSIAIPNIIGLYALAPLISRKLKEYEMKFFPQKFH